MMVETTLYRLVLTAAISMFFAVPVHAEKIADITLRAEQGDVETQYDLGIMYVSGRGVSKNDVEAVKWFRRAAEQGFMLAQFNLGLMYAKGEGVPQDYAEGFIWSSVAVAMGDDEAIYNRDLSAKNLSPDALTAAQARATSLSEELHQRK